MEDIDDVPALMDDQEISDNEDEDWQEMEEDEQTNCLFCTLTFSSVENAMEHLKSLHNIDLAVLKGKFNMDFYSYIKMINYIRISKIQDKEFLTLQSIQWEDEKYLKPIEHESWLMYDFDELNVPNTLSNENNKDTILQKKCNEYEEIIKKLQENIIEKNSLLEQAFDDIEKMKNSYRLLLDAEENNHETQRANIINGDVACVGNLSLQDDEGYFSSYAHYGIHHDMLSDEVRTQSYRDAILKNVETFKMKNVLDLGCGTSILSMFSSKAGAAQVVGIDQSDIIYQAMDIVRKNNFSNINLIKGRLEDTELPIDKFDIIVSEWMGYFLLFEGMLDSVIYARNRHLKEGGILLPNRCNISLIGYGDTIRHNEVISFWKNVYGFDMSCMTKEVLREAIIEVCKPEYILTTSNIIAEFDLMKVGFDCPNFSFNFNLNVTKSGKLTSLVGYFDTFFDLPEKVMFSTSPDSKPTHWKQIIFYFKKVIDVNEGDIIKGKFVCLRNPKDVRSLSVTIEMFDNIYRYNLN